MSRPEDDVYKRKIYKDDRFDGKKTIIDDYTGEKVYYGNTADAQRRHPIDKTVDIDHVVPIDVVKKLYPDLSIDQQKKLVNNIKNYVITNSSLNRSKGGKENHEYLLKQFFSGEPENIKTTINMISKEIDSHIIMGVEATGMRIGNTAETISQNVTQLSSNIPQGLKTAGADFAEGAVDAIIDSTIPIVVESVNNMIQVVRGKKELKQATKDIGNTTMNIAVSGGINKMLDILPNDQMKQIVNVAVIVKDSALRYVNGEINGKEFIDEVGNKGTNMVASLIAGEVGKEIGFILGGVVGNTVLPGAGAYVGALVGEVVGQVVCSLIVTTACGLIITAKDTLKHMNDYKLKESKIKKLTNNALTEMDNQRKVLKDIIESENNEWDNNINDAFSIIHSSLNSELSVQQSFDQITNGLDKILSMFKSEAAFHTPQEYRDQLDTVLVI